MEGVAIIEGSPGLGSLVLLVLVVTFAAFCVWLAIRIVNRRERWAKWTLVVSVIGLPACYVLSSGPLIPLAFYRATIQMPMAEDDDGKSGDGHYEVEVVIVRYEWWRQVYGPLHRMSQDSWAAPLRWYWDLFPIPIETAPD